MVTLCHGKVGFLHSSHERILIPHRAYALQRHRPLTLQATITLPTSTEDPTEPAPPLTGFIHLVSLFRPFDDQFISLWNKARTDCSPSYLAALQQKLTDALPAYLNSTESQAADLRTSQQWLRTMVWQLSIQNGCLSSGSENLSMTFQYPIDIARDLISMTSQFSSQSMEVHGIGLVSYQPSSVQDLSNIFQIEKLFDVACSLTDVLSLMPTPNDPFALGPRDYLNQFLTLLSTLRSGDSRFLPLLLAKVHDVLPRLASPMLQTVPVTNSEKYGIDPNVDIFDGFGNAGMGVPSSLPAHYDGKRIEDLNGQSDRNGDESPFSSSSHIEFSGLGEFPGFAEMPTMPNSQPGVPRSNTLAGQRRLPRAPPNRQNSSNSTYTVNNAPRSISEAGPPQMHQFHGAQHHLPRDGSGLEHMMGVGETNMMYGRNPLAQQMKEEGLEHGLEHAQRNHHHQGNMGLNVEGLEMPYA